MLRSTATQTWRIAPLATIVCLLSCGSETSVEVSPEFIAAMNRGKAYLENQDPTMAVQAFEKAVADAPKSAPDRKSVV